MRRPTTFIFPFPICLLICLLALATARPALAGTELPETIVLSPEVLNRARQQAWARDRTVGRAVAALTARADSAMKAAVEPVPARPEPGGNRMTRAYRSLSPYWWPDPQAKNGLPYVRRDGERNPEADSDRYDRGRLTRMARTVRTLALAWYFTGDERYAARATAHVRAWFCDPATRMIPDLDHAQMRPGLDQGNRTGIIETATLIPVCDAVRLLEPSQAWTRTDTRRLREWFGQYLGWLLRSDPGRAEAASLNNHGTWFDAQVAVFALFRGDRELAREVAGLTGNRRISTQILPDGTMPRELERTRPRHYTFFNLEAFMVLAAVGERCGLDLYRWASATGQSIRRALDHAGPFLAQDRPMNGASEPDFDPHPYVPLFRRAALVYKDTRYLDYLDALDAKTLARQPSFIAY
ncbi:hypothetical protein DND132_1446 [Pseudodesulfovibrio mercurii]|uniref:Alginate lyase domain-containing protein n=1 Tax=Pseudodesulfovibrio mercurii TaxID=641491 RepID=F0JE45_9BACT|nr:alginate lyase family protein [Pseudodesulfovibrio mercurii]EGB14654.1 hypothetical protein DND132_1446 [Pseudodesulfovibrio mercurii]